MKLFAEKATNKTRLKAGKYELLIEHGDRISPSGDELYPWFPVNKYTMILLQKIYSLVLMIFKDKFLYYYHKSHLDRMKIWAKEHLVKNQILVCGHGHLLKKDIENKYICIGLLRDGYGQYLKITDDKIEIINGRY